MKDANIKKTFKIKSTLKEIDPLINTILSCLEQEGIASYILHDVKLAIHEALINAVKHGNKLEEKLSVVVDFSYSKDEINISVQDEGKGYNYVSIPDPTLDENITKTSGRGLFLIKEFMDTVRFNSAGNRIEMVKRIPR